jgi:hypothetical protein
MTNNLLPFIVLSAVVAGLDIVPLLFRKLTWRYRLSVFTNIFVLGLVVLFIGHTGLPWWLIGIVAGLLLVAPRLILPPARGTMTWKATLANSLIVGFIFSLVRHYLQTLAQWFA